MAFRNAQQARIYVDILSAAAYTRNVSLGSATGMIDTTTIVDEERNFIPEMEDTGTFSIDGPLDVDGTANGQFDAIATLKESATPTPITFLPLGTDGHLWLIQSNEDGVTIDNSLGDTANWSMSAVTHGQHDLGGELLDQDRTDTTTTDGSSTDSGAGTTNGAVAHLHVTAYATLTSADILIEHSTTGAFAGEEATLFTFTQATGVTSERLTVTGTVNRYLRVTSTLAGSGSVTFTVALARR